MEAMRIMCGGMLFLFLIACTSSETVKIGAVFHLTGAGSFWGATEKNAAVLAVEDINKLGGIKGKPLELIIEDGKTDFPQTTNSFLKLINVDKVPVIVGPTWFGQVAAPIAEENKVTVVSPSTGTTVKREKYFFNLWHTERQEVIPVTRYMEMQGVQKVAIVYSQNDWSVSMKNNFIDEANNEGIEVIKKFATGADETDFRTVILELKQLNIDAIYAPIAFYPSQGAFSKQIKELNFNVPHYSTTDTENQLLLDAYPEIEGTIYPYPVKTSAESKFFERYEARFNSSAAPSAAYAYDAINIVAEALKSGAKTSDEIAEYLTQIKSYPGISNMITFEDGRVIEKVHIMKKVTNRTFQKIN